MALKGKHGAMLAGRYRLLEQLGEGGMGSVWKAEHLVLSSHVAIKIIDPDVARLEFNLARFLREAKTLATLRSPNVVQVLDFGSDAETPYLVMELLQGQTLGRRLTVQGRLSLRETSRILDDVCTAMSLVHEQGLIHRDLKPENIFLCEVGDQQITKIVDFGIAKSLRGDMTASMKTRTGHMLGTPSYMSPEQCRGLKDIDHRADLWALGVIAYECLVGKVPFEGEVLGDLLLRICMDPLPVPSRQLSGALPDGFDAWFAKAVARDRSTRFQSASELSKALADLASTAGLAGNLSASDRPAAARGDLARSDAARGDAARGDAARPDAHRSSPLRAPVSRPAASRPDASRPHASRPDAVRSAPAASLQPRLTPRQPANTETNTSVGFGVNLVRNVDRRTRLLALGAAALLAAVAGLWAIGTKRDGGIGTDVQSLRPPYEVTPRELKPSRVPVGRRWQPTAVPPSTVPPPNRPASGGASGVAEGTAAAVALPPAPSPTPGSTPGSAAPASSAPSNAVPHGAAPNGVAPSNVAPGSLAGASSSAGSPAMGSTLGARAPGPTAPGSTAPNATVSGVSPAPLAPGAGPTPSTALPLVAPSALVPSLASPGGASPGGAPPAASPGARSTAAAAPGQAPAAAPTPRPTQPPPAATPPAAAPSTPPAARTSPAGSPPAAPASPPATKPAAPPPAAPSQPPAASAPPPAAPSPGAASPGAASPGARPASPPAAAPPAAAPPAAPPRPLRGTSAPAPNRPAKGHEIRENR